MNNNDDENQELLKKIKSEEAGVKELLECYDGVETIYANSINVLAEEYYTFVSNTTDDN